MSECIHKDAFLLQGKPFCFAFDAGSRKSPVHDLRCFSVGERLSENFEHPAGYVREFNPRSGSEVIREEAVEVVLDHRRRDDNLDLLKKEALLFRRSSRLKPILWQEPFEELRTSSSKSRNH